MKQHEMFELKFDCKEPKNLAQPNISAVFSCNGKSKKLKGFCDGEGHAVIRFLPEEAGIYKWNVSGIVSAQGEELCEENNGECGKIVASGTHFEYAGGALFRPFGTTIYALPHQTPELVAQSLKTLESAPFNKVRFCLFPKHYDYNNNDPQYFPFEKKGKKWDVTKPVKAYWDNIERVLTRLGELKIQADIILFHPYDCWGFSSLSPRECIIYLDTVMRRISAFPNLWWSMANEYDLCFFRSMGDWHRIERFIAANDAYHHLLSNHNCFKTYNYARKNITHVSIQSRSTGRTKSLIEKYKKPVIFDECCYEGNLPLSWGNISAIELVNRFWQCFASGGYCTHGEVFLDDNDVLWWAKGGVLKGESPQRIAFLRKFAEGLPGALEPYSEKHVFPNDLFSSKGVSLGRKLAMAGNLIKFARTLVAPERRAQLSDETGLRSSHVGDDVFLFYYERTCPGVGKINLPEGNKYRLEVIDVWNMIRETIINNAEGETSFKLPSKECIAMLATKIS